MADLFDEALAADRVVLSVVGPHAGEGEGAIFLRKMADVTAIGKTFWLCCSPPARPDRLLASGAELVIFLSPSTARGARPTMVADRAVEFSPDGGTWFPFPGGLSPVTGNLRAGAYAFVFSDLRASPSPIDLDLWCYEVDGDPVRFRLGASALLARRASVQHKGARSRFRRVLAVGQLADLCAVWLR